MCAGSKADVEQLVSDFLGDDAKVRALVDTYLHSRPSATAPTDGSLSTGTALGRAGLAAGHEVSSRNADSIRGSGLSSTGGQTLVGMREQQVRGAACSRQPDQ